MKSYINISTAVVVLLASAAFGQPAPSAGAAAPAPDANAVGVPSFPYVAEIVGDNVNIRSGPGTNYYNCGKANNGDKVKVVSRQFSWSSIVPPAGSFSWIYIPYVSIDPDSPGTGIVTGDNVRVYAGSDLIKPIHSTLQLKLDRGERVKLLGEQKDNYYKIAPPTGAYLWVSTKFTKPFAPPTVPPRVVDTVDPNTVRPVDVNDVNEVAVKPVVPPPEPTASVEARLLTEYKALQKKILAERSKPIEQQDYSGIRKALEAIAANKKAGKVARYCEYVLKQITRYELAQKVHKELALQNKQLKATQERIEQARKARLAQVKNLGRFAVIGKLQVSNIYGIDATLKHYRIIGETGKTLCYARPSAGAQSADYSNLAGKKVGLIGTITAHPQTGGALVKFTQLVEMN